jgi:hypothetical protein
MAGFFASQPVEKTSVTGKSKLPSIKKILRASLMPGEDPMTLDTPEQAAEFIVPMCSPDWTETGKFCDYKSRTLMSFRPPA